MSNNPKIGFIGAGNIANNLSVALSRAGYRIHAVNSRTIASAQILAEKLQGCKVVNDASELSNICDVVFITTPDYLISKIAEELQWQDGQYVIHCSGSITMNSLHHAKECGAFIGSLHPMLSLSYGSLSELDFQGVSFAIEGDGQLLNWLETVVYYLGGVSIQIPSNDRSLYHAASVMVSGYILTVLDSADSIWSSIDTKDSDSVPHILPLVRSVLANIESIGLSKVATGPIARGDVDTVRYHLIELANRVPQILPMYCQLGLSMVSLCLKYKYIDMNVANEFRTMINSYLELGTSY